MACCIMDYDGLTSDSLMTFTSVALICCPLYTCNSLYIDKDKVLYINRKWIHNKVQGSLLSSEGDL